MLHRFDKLSELLLQLWFKITLRISLPSM